MRVSMSPHRVAWSRQSPHPLQPAHASAFNHAGLPTVTHRAAVQHARPTSMALDFPHESRTHNTRNALAHQGRAMSRHVEWNSDEVEFKAIRAQGPGGQNVNKVSSAIQARLDVHSSSLPEDVKARLLALNDGRLTQDGVLIIKAQSHRTQAMNRASALRRIQSLVASVAQAPKARRATKPTYGSQQRRLQSKAQRAQTKAGRSRVND
jgi:ribosome-associated protein